MIFMGFVGLLVLFDCGGKFDLYSAVFCRLVGWFVWYWIGFCWLGVRLKFSVVLGLLGYPFGAC